MPDVLVDGLPVVYERHGSGPVVLVPQCNLPWTAYGIEPLLDHFTVVAVAPRGYGESTRLTPPDYSPAQLRSDVERVLDHLGLGEYATLGYSLNGAVASLLALDNPRVVAVVCGGFPTGAAYAGLARSRREQLAVRRRDPALWAETVAALDPAALIAVWELVDALPPGTLLSGPTCPVFSWWGGADPLFEAFGGVAAQRAAVRDLGLEYTELPGLDHDEALGATPQIVPVVGRWLEKHWH